MRIALATCGFTGFGGSETYLLTLAEQLELAGHDVAIHAHEGGAMAEFARERGVRVLLGESELEDAPDALVVQDGVVAYELADRWPGVPQLFRACSDLYGFQLPPQLPDVVAAVAVASDRMAERVRALDLQCDVVRLRHPVDAVRFAPRGEIRARPARAVLLGNYLDGERRRLLEETWGAAGVTCVAVGARGVPDARPEDAIADADIVVGKGRAALEGMACGRAVYVLDAFGGDGWVTPDSYPALEADNFAGCATGWSLSAERLAADLDAYRPAMGQVNRDLVITHHSARKHAHEMVEVLRRLVPGALPAGTPLRELARLVRVHRRAEFEADSLRAALGTSATRQHDAEARVTAAATRVAELEAQVAELGSRGDDAEAVAVELRGRVAELEALNARLAALLETRRVRAGLGIGAALDRIRRR